MAFRQKTCRRLCCELVTLWCVVGLTFRGLGQGAVEDATSVGFPEVSGSFERYWKYNMMPPLRVWKAGAEGHTELVCDFSPVLRSNNLKGE
jgi:hypothetical protein